MVEEVLDLLLSILSAGTLVFYTVCIAIFTQVKVQKYYQNILKVPKVKVVIVLFSEYVIFFYFNY